MENEAKAREEARRERARKDRKNAQARARRADRKAAEKSYRETIAASMSADSSAPALASDSPVLSSDARRALKSDAVPVRTSPHFYECEGDIKNEPIPCPFCDKLFPGVYGLPGVAQLRADNKTLICADCGTREALEGGLRMPVSKFLERYGSHDIYLADITARKFLAWTGERAPWVPHSAAKIRRMIAERGLGGHYDSDQPGIAGYEMAVACAWEFARFHSVKNGRGTIMRECIEALRGNGR